jgi:hypothetical protein
MPLVYRCLLERSDIIKGSSAKLVGPLPLLMLAAEHRERCRERPTMTTPANGSATHRRSNVVEAA